MRRSGADVTDELTWTLQTLQASFTWTLQTLQTSLRGRCRRHRRALRGRCRRYRRACVDVADVTDAQEGLPNLTNRHLL